MVRLGFALVAAAALWVAIGSEASAQGVGWWSPVILEATSGNGATIGDILGGVIVGSPGRGEVEVRQQQGRGRGNVRAANGRGGGPPFCRNGRGHPVHGRQWCAEKGWIGGSTWAREGWADVIFGGRIPDRERTVNQPTIGDILGDVILGRITRFGRDAGLSGSLDGRWVPIASGGSVLQLRMGGQPIAELADLNRDGRADVVLLNHAY